MMLFVFTKRCKFYDVTILHKDGNDYKVAKSKLCAHQALSKSVICTGKAFKFKIAGQAFNN